MYRLQFSAWQQVYHHRLLGPVYLQPILDDEDSINVTDAVSWIILWKIAASEIAVDMVITITEELKTKKFKQEGQEEGHTLAEIILLILTF